MLLLANLLAAEAKDGEGVWIRRDQPSEAAEAGQREWLRVSGSDEVMQAFKAELLAMQPDAQVFTPVIVAPGTTRIHQVNCALVRAGQRFTHLQCPSCAGDLQSEFDRLVPDESKVLHSQLTCPALKEVAQGRLLILPGISSGICSGISSGILSGISSGILSGISSGILSDILSGISSGILSGR